MNPIAVFRSLSMQQKIISAGAVLATLLVMTLIARQVSQPNLSLLYADLEPATAGEVIARLDNMGVNYRVDGGAIYADSSRRDSLRLELARESLPRQDVVGYELFDGLNSFAMSSDMFDTAYWRAKEGELARTILAMPNVRAARVHVGQGAGRGLTARRQPTTASVTLTSQPSIDARRAQAVQYLVALAVPGLKPEDVAVIDTQAGLLAGPGLDDAATSDAAGELGRAATIKSELLSLLEARVGPGNVRVNVSLDLETDRTSRTERRFDPNGRVLRSTTTSDRSNQSDGTTGNVTVASNLPEGAAGGGNQTSEQSETTETMSYEISETLTTTESLPGKVTRMSVAVLLDHRREVADDGTISFVPRTQDELDALQSLASAAAGLNTERGDVLRVDTLAFDRPEPGEMITPPGAASRFVDQHGGRLAQLTILSLLAFGLAFFVIRPMLRVSRGGVGALPAPSGAGLSPMTLNGLDPADDMADASAQALGLEGGQGNGQGGALGLPAPDPRAALNDAVEENMDDAAALLASWLDTDASDTRRDPPVSEVAA
ncbi:flagellar basal-body MS-ring/collar protein FliF [Algimonas porphyrae]|uniref:Flagellar M-ring protein n=1 Tax=Algimonas porphyrae TaxID=1128113 RepID=A0ABQ5V397_9PROT|nr:flagellar basal-body MS-ring/collar protein FliF [Algimonas porphyrae]GLQ21452.1 flagellar M-ring protein [Algimonas porphyrae]